MVRYTIHRNGGGYGNPSWRKNRSVACARRLEGEHRRRSLIMSSRTAATGTYSSTASFSPYAACTTNRRRPGSNMDDLHERLLASMDGRLNRRGGKNMAAERRINAA